jgi:hypothetical protein
MATGRIQRASRRTAGNAWRALGALAILAAFTAPASAQPIFHKGDAVVTGFSGTTTGASPDQALINVDGTSAEIISIAPAGAPSGQILTPSASLQIKASQIGQVFAITLDDAPVPNAYLAATSAYGLQIVTPASSGPQRALNGAADADWMPGQFGTTLGGGPGSIYKIDGNTGAVTLFATVGSNSGPGIGDVVFDKTTHQFFVSDLDTGLIYRLNQKGSAIDSFDHGVAALGLIGLVPVPDDGAVADIHNPAFNVQDPGTWGITPKGRRIGGLAVHGGRLYYAVADGPQVWSVGISAGGFAADARIEIDGSAWPTTSEITDIAFDGAGRIYLAQRGDQTSSADYSAFVDPHKAAVVRYQPDPLDPASWVLSPEAYAVGTTPDYQDATGGIDIGLSSATGKCDMLWSTGDELSSDGQTVNGVQGNDVGLVRPANVPPTQTYLIDYDGQMADPTAFGHVGDVEMWRNCSGSTTASAGGGVEGGGVILGGDVTMPGGGEVVLPPGGGTMPPGGGTMPPPGGETPPVPPGGITVTKTADGPCSADADHVCGYTITVANTGATDFTDALTLTDTASKPGQVEAAPEPGDAPWNCGVPTGTEQMQCTLPAATPTIMANHAITFHVEVHVRHDVVAEAYCEIGNHAVVTWKNGSADSGQPALADLPDQNCIPLPEDSSEPTSDGLDLAKSAGDCVPQSGSIVCSYVLTVTNIGTTPYTKPVTVEDGSTMPGVTVTADPAANPDWMCAPPIPGDKAEITCVRQSGKDLAPNAPATINVTVTVPVTPSSDFSAQSCSVPNSAQLNGDTATRVDVAAQMPPGTAGCYPPADNPPTSTPTPSTPPSTSTVEFHKEAGGTCVHFMDNYECEYSLIFKNNDKSNPYLAPLSVTDAVPAIPGATIEHNGGIVTWDCSASTPTLLSCVVTSAIAGHTIATGSQTEVDVKVKIPVASVADTTSCTVHNIANAVIEGATVTSSADDQLPTDPSDNSGCKVAAAPPAPASQGSVKFSKVGDGVCTVDGADRKCGYTLNFENGDPADPYVGPLGVSDIASGLIMSIVVDAPAPEWDCSASTATQVSCEFDTPAGIPTIPMNSKLSVHVIATVPGSAAPKDGSCTISNEAIATSSSTADLVQEGDDQLPDCGTSAAPTAKLVPVTSGVDERGLFITKKGLDCAEDSDHAGFDCRFLITVTNASATNQVPGPVAVTEIRPFAYGEIHADLASAVGAWTCPTLEKNGGECDAAGPVLPNQSLVLPIVVHVAKSDDLTQSGCVVPNAAEFTGNDNSMVADLTFVPDGTGGCASNVLAGTTPPPGTAVMSNTVDLPNACGSLGAGWKRVADPRRLPKTATIKTLLFNPAILVSCAKINVNATPLIANADLSLTKTGQSCTRNGLVISCTYDVTITNLGPAPLPAQKIDFIDVVETKAPGTTVDKPRAPWACDNGQWHFHCWQTAALPVGGKLTAKITVHPGAQFQRYMSCAMPNAAYLNEPAAGTQWNKVASNDNGRATDNADLDACNIPCPDGWTKVIGLDRFPATQWDRQTIGDGTPTGSIYCVKQKPKPAPANPKPKPKPVPKSNTTTTPPAQQTPPVFSPLSIFCPDGQLRLLGGSCPPPRQPNPPPKGNGNTVKLCPDGSPMPKNGLCPAAKTGSGLKINRNSIFTPRILTAPDSNSGLH